ncbi:MAG TPA: S-layer homology domain-containing protein [Chloroflexia bacterium]|nr:S-layer homology domain-containing protein [Chloroflexia bacterium]
MKTYSLSLQYRLAAIALLLVGVVLYPLGARASENGASQISGTTNTGPTSPATCALPFTDVQTSDYFYEGVFNLFCRGAIGGYPDNTFRPGNNTTRGQLAKIEVLAKGWELVDPATPSFSDVVRDNPFYQYIETALVHNVLGGYTDGTFRPTAEVTRSQLAKVVVSAEGWPLVTPGSPTFSDVPSGSTFYSYVETAVAHGVLSGYTDGMFRPGNAATRGQIAKIVYLATAPQMTAEEAETIRIINERRAAMGIGTLRIDPAMNAAARRHSFDIGPQQLCQHTGTDGTTPWDRLAQAGYGGWGAGEVVACNYVTPLDAVDGWWDSPGHYAVLTDPAVNDIGCGWWINSEGYGWQTCDTGISVR